MTLTDSGLAFRSASGATAASNVPADEDLELLGHYDLLVPGSDLMARYLVLQPIYLQHPLRGAISRIPAIN